MVGQENPCCAYAKVGRGTGGWQEDTLGCPGKKLTQQRRPGSGRGKSTRCEPRSALFSPQETRPFQRLGLSIGDAPRLRTRQPTQHRCYTRPVEGQWLPEQGSHHHPIWHIQGIGVSHRRPPLMWAWGSGRGHPPASSHAAPAAAEGEPTPGKAVEKETVPFNVALPP